MIFLIRSHYELGFQRFKRDFPFQQLIDEFTLLIIEECHFIGLIVDDNRFRFGLRRHECFRCYESAAVSVFHVDMVNRRIVSHQ